MNEPRLISPTVTYKDSVIAAYAEFRAEGRYARLDLDWMAAHFDGYVAGLLSRRHTPTRPGAVTSHELWLVDGDMYIGRFSIRHELNESLKTYGGHIGYDVRPSMRLRGYGTRGLALLIPIARDLGLTRLLITCDETNTGSQKIIAANGGVYHDTVQNKDRDVPTQHWWVEIAPK